MPSLFINAHTVSFIYFAMFWKGFQNLKYQYFPCKLVYIICIKNSANFKILWSLMHKTFQLDNFWHKFWRSHNLPEDILKTQQIVVKQPKVKMSLLIALVPQVCKQKIKWMCNSWNDNLSSSQRPVLMLDKRKNCNKIFGMLDVHAV